MVLGGMFGKITTGEGHSSPPLPERPSAHAVARPRRYRLTVSGVVALAPLAVVTRTR